YLFFFFSSIRRHTRSKRDWSSDVCSSDLDILDFLSGQRRNKQVRRIVAAHPRTSAETLWKLTDDEDLEVRQAIALNPSSPPDLRSEERRAGNEWRSQG